MANLRRYCLCGGSLIGAAGSRLAAALEEAFEHEHTGAEHGPATPGQAARARRRFDIVTITEPAEQDGADR